jgi:hypothetical protein
MAAISVYTQSLGYAYDEASQGPDLASIIVSAQQNEEDHKSLEDHDLIAVEEVCSGESLFQSEAIPDQQRRPFLAPFLETFLCSRTGHSSVVDSEQ